MRNEKADRASREGRVISIARVSPSTVGDHRISGSPPSWKSSRVITGEFPALAPLLRVPFGRVWGEEANLALRTQLGANARPHRQCSG